MDKMARVTTQRKPTDGVDGNGARLLRLDEAIERLAISRSMAWKLVASQELKALRIGRAVRVRPVDLEAFLERAAGEG